jgi:hypothetical protein
MKERLTRTHTMSLAADEQVATLVLLWLMRDAKVGWEKWGHVAFVSRAWRDAFKINKAQVDQYRLAHMSFLLAEARKQLHIFRVCCNCRVAFPTLWSDEEEAGSPLPSPEY